MRLMALEGISDQINDFRPGTTVNEVLKKIQTLRTQYGQELGKKEKKEGYKPTIYWFEPLGFLKKYMKKRNTIDGYTVQSIKQDQSETSKSGNDKEYFELEEISIAENSEYSPPTKRGRLVKEQESLNEGIFPDQELETIEYTVIDSQQSDAIPSASRKPISTQFVEITAQPTNIKEHRAKKRAKGLGKFVQTLMSEIVDEKLFFETQQKVLGTIYEAQMKQIL
jgi:hypothetical protein